MAVPRLARTAPRLVSAVCLATVVANAVIVVTGALVRLTGSGLGCPTWPSCTGASITPSPEMGIHGIIEFSNRMLTFVLSVVVGVAIVTILLLRRQRRDLVALSWSLFVGIVAQAVIGGITVLTGLNPWTVAAHFLVSMGLVAAAVALHVRSREPVGPARPLVGPQMRWLGRALVGVTAVVLVLGTIVTASGPHSGDSAAQRTGFDLAMMSQLHADAVMLLVGLTVATLVALYATAAPTSLRRAVWALVAVEVAQGAIGYAQYFTHLPVALVALHVLGACLVWIAALYVLFAMRVRASLALPAQDADAPKATPATV